MVGVLVLDRQSNPETTSLEEDTVFDLLGNERRRASLSHLLTSDEKTPVNELARSVAGEVTDGSTESEDLEHSVYISLCQSHLPKLDRADVIEYDSDVKTVRRGPAFDQVGPYLDRQPSSPHGWRFLTVASVVTVLLLTLVVVDLPLAQPLFEQVLLVIHLAMSAFGISHLLGN